MDGFDQTVNVKVSRFSSFTLQSFVNIDFLAYSHIIYIWSWSGYF